MGMLDEFTLGEGDKVADRCPHCDRDTSLEVVENHRVLPEWEPRLVGPSGIGQLPFFAPMDPFTLLRVFTCMFCSKTTLVLLRWKAGLDPMDAATRPAAEAEIVWPRRSPRELPSEAPTEVRDLFREAPICEESGALRGAAGLLRACVDAITKEQGITKGNLQDKIDGLQTKIPALDADMIRDLHDARLTGNWSLHDGVTFDAAEVADVAALVEEAVEVIYVQPARRAAMAAARTARRQGQAP